MLTVPFGKEEVVIAKVVATTMLNCFVAVCAVGVDESVAFTVNVNVPAAVGVPVMAPLVAPMESPAGSAPALMVNVSGFNPPVAETV